MLYTILKIPAKWALYLYCRSIKINHKEFLNADGPLLIAANHPNSFLDAIILASLFKKPIYSLARGDAFVNKTIATILHALKMLPVYRISEGVENLESNYQTFEACISIFKKNGIVLIFSEGKCINEWHLRALKKGTARLANSAWENDIPLRVLPLGINYHSFNSFGKNVILNFGNYITKENCYQNNSFGKNVGDFNTALQNQLSDLVFEIDKKDTKKLIDTFEIPISGFNKMLLTIPAVLGYILHFPLYYPIKKIVRKQTISNDHFDSIIVGLLFILYPIYVLIICGIAQFIFKTGLVWLGIIILPLLGWSYIQRKPAYKK